MKRNEEKIGQLAGVFFVLSLVATALGFAIHFFIDNG